MYKLFTDGGSRGNPGNAACASFLFGKNNELIDFNAQFLGKATNNVAEYQGLIIGLELALKYSPNELICNLDSELIVKQIKGEYAVKHPSMKPLYQTVLTLKDMFKKIDFIHIPRAHNKFADRLVNVILDTQPSITLT